MTPKIEQAEEPRRLSREARRLISEAEAAGFRHLGWLTVTLFIGPMTIAGFANDEGDIALGMNAMACEASFRPKAVDLVSQFAGKRKLTSTTFRMAFTQPHRGIYKYSYPDASIAELLTKHRKHMREMDARITTRVHTLDDFASAIRKYVKHEFPG